MDQQESSAQIAESYVLKGADVRVVERFFSVPLDYSKPDGQKIRVFARSLIPLDDAKVSADQQTVDSDRPYFLYLQGGPGFEVNLFSSLDLAAIIHKKGYQTLWLDQRGTGLSTPISVSSLTSQTDGEIAQYLKHFRADNIVRDCEFIRKTLIGGKKPEEDRKWTIMGQSFGGFCATTYLSFHSEGLKEVFLTGGLPPLVDHPDPVYRRLFERVAKRNEVYYAKYPRDVQRVRKILSYVGENNVQFPDSGQLTPSRWLQLGFDLGMHAGIDRIHQLVLRAATDLETSGSLSYGLLCAVQSKQSFDTNPIYAILHEPLYCQGRAAQWSAHRLLEEHPQFRWETAKQMDENIPVYFTGEMIFPGMFDDYANLRPLRRAAELLAAESDWDKLYDISQLKKNTVKVNTATYYDDMYVDFELSQETAATIANTEQYITNQNFHNGIRKNGQEILTTLFEISKRLKD
ncbi:alpha/beta-hydrolase [Hygrophoropsis aurantiaca]|uniref:Alpha/beta-hydrolase n=1 Tax=Hygrophoropsis aurantiaca TaxID=72124 RepID=A0ACB8A6J5_9AGAM|nr:alpha/beta-hydrolase [Hygrophoropsis aurantiaca]